MGILVDRNTPPVAVRFGNEPDDGLEINTVFIKAKLSLGDTIQIEEASYKMEFASGGEGDDAAQPYRVPMSPVGQMIAALRHAVTGWEGPLFEGIRYRRSIWQDIDGLESPVVVLVMPDGASRLEEMMYVGLSKAQNHVVILAGEKTIHKLPGLTTIDWPCIS